MVKIIDFDMDGVTKKNIQNRIYKYLLDCEIEEGKFIVDATLSKKGKSVTVYFYNCLTEAQNKEIKVKIKTKIGELLLINFVHPDYFLPDIVKSETTQSNSYSLRHYAYSDILGRRPKFNPTSKMEEAKKKELKLYTLSEIAQLSRDNKGFYALKFKRKESENILLFKNGDGTLYCTLSVKSGDDYLVTTDDLLAKDWQIVE